MFTIANFIQAFPNDSGPIYRETIDGGFPVETFNTLSNLVFLGIIVYFAKKVFANPKKHLFLSGVLPVLSIGFVGGILYHGTRSAEIWLLMDWVPIRMLSLAAVVYFVLKWKTNWVTRAVLLAIILGANTGLRYIPMSTRWENNLGYTISALSILIPVLGYLFKTRFKNWPLVLSAFAIFALAIFFRVLDKDLESDFFYMGTHWLWHTFGGIAVFFLMKYIFLDNQRQPVGNG
ncbi:MAG: hypothetical protein WBG71_01635 [Leeuwenhoekiella sp.]